MTSRSEMIRKLRGLANSSNEHEAKIALEKAQPMEAKLGATSAKALAHAIAQVLEERGMVVRVRRHRAEEFLRGLEVDADVRYRVSRYQNRWWPKIAIEITEYE